MVDRTVPLIQTNKSNLRPVNRKKGTFPEGTLISGFRCVDPNTSARGAEEHGAKCVCDGSNCQWDRDLPVCTTHGLNYSGYSWTMTSSPIEGSICVSGQESMDQNQIGFVFNKSKTSSNQDQEKFQKPWTGPDQDRGKFQISDRTRNDKILKIWDRYVPVGLRTQQSVDSCFS